MATSEEDNWEYEYDEEETEDFYIPIDLANIPELQAPITGPSQKYGHPWLLKTKLRAFYANRKELESLQAQSATYDAESSESLGEIQLIGLHTPNPLIMYNGQLLSCHWTSALGTDFVFQKSDPDATGEGKLLRSLPDVDLIATSSARLVARVGQLRPKDEAVEQVDIVDRDEESMKDLVSNGDGSNGIRDEQIGSKTSRPAPSSFLAKLNAAKTKRGDESRLMISSDGSRLVAEKVSLQRSEEEHEPDDASMNST